MYIVSQHWVTSLCFQWTGNLHLLSNYCGVMCSAQPPPFYCMLTAPHSVVILIPLEHVRNMSSVKLRGVNNFPKVSKYGVRTEGRVHYLQ